MRAMGLKAACFLVVTIVMGAGPANAQWSNYDGFQYSPAPPPPYAGRGGYAQPSPYAGDQDYDYYGEPAPPPRGARPYARRSPDQGYAQPSYDPRDRADLNDSYASPPPANREQLELQADSSRRTVQLVPNPTREPAGTIVVDTRTKHLYLVQADGSALSYGIGVGRQGFEWKGEARVQHKSEWPAWNPPPEMLKRRPDIPEHMAGGLDNPLGARALYLFQGNKDTLFRIHGTNEPDTIGRAVSSGCIRMMNADVIDLYRRVPVGTRVVVL
jgi:lipoprotein-anchoring transpeptidase ErfK/SrfK